MTTTIARCALHGAAALLSAGLALAPVAAAAQSYPDKPVLLVVPFPAGGSGDILARQIADKASPLLGQNIIVENRPGAGGAIGADSVAKAPADGYTLVFGTNGSQAASVTLIQDLQYDPLTDFTPVARLANQPLVAVVSKGLGVNSIAELVERAKTGSGVQSFASLGVGTSAHLGGALLNASAGVNFRHVPYTNSTAFTDLLEQRITLMYYPYTSLKSYLDAGELTPLATTGATRASWLPDVPTMVEAGYPDFQLVSWFAIYGPAGLPDEVVTKLSEVFEATMSDPEFVATIGESGNETWYADATELAAFTASEIDRYRELLTSIGLP